MAEKLASERLKSGKKSKKNPVHRDKIGKVKSPSDTTLYAPALRQIVEQNLVMPTVGNAALNEQIVTNPPLTIESQEVSDSQMIQNNDLQQKDDASNMDQVTNQIIQFIEGIRMKGNDAGPRQGKASQAIDDHTQARANQYVVGVVA